MRCRFLGISMGLATMALAPAASAQTDAGAPLAVLTTTPTTTPAPVAAVPTAGGDAGADEVVTGERYQVRLRDLEARINELKEEIFRSKARLSLLAESVLGNSVGGSRARITHQNEMGSTYRLVSLVYSLDAAPIVTRRAGEEESLLADERTLQVFNGQIGSGDHTLGVNLEYVGAGLPYMKGYRFTVRSTQSFTVPEGKAIDIRVVGFEKGGPLEAPENRPAVRYVQRVMSLREASENAESGEPSGSTGASPEGAAGGNSNP
jgi:hypothetical protein